jgi:quinol monooxygenase YgiN
MSSQIDLLAIITPKPGKADRVRYKYCPTSHASLTCFQVVELLQEVSEYVHKNEPDTLKYQINREVNEKSGAEQVIMMETLVSASPKRHVTDFQSRYKSKAAMGVHGSSKEFKAFQKKMAEEDLVGAPMQLKFVKVVGGFTSRL